MKIAIVVSKFNEFITGALLSSTTQRLQQLGTLPENIKVITVPGAVEIPLTAQLLAQQKKFSAIICLGAVIRGETQHYDYVCQQVSFGCQRVMLDYNIPVIFGVQTTENKTLAFARTHKGAEAADAAIAMIMIVNELTSSELDQTINL